MKTIRLLLSLVLSLVAPASIDAVDDVDFGTQIRPLLVSKCFDCHGPDTQESHLRLDRRAAMLRGGDSGEPAIVAGDGEKSHLIQLVRGAEAGKRMPPDEANRLSTDEIQLLQAWIDEGAVWPGPDGAEDDETTKSDHWAFQSVKTSQAPKIDDPWVANGIDAFVLQQLTEHSLTHNPQATRPEIIRRMSLDMLGLPPTPEDVRDFVADRHPQAVQRLVGKILDSPHYGERWSRYWLDLVRFAETNGYETNRERPNAWPYRDYVIRSLNDDKPYDQFLKEQIAGDAVGTPEATAYLVAGPYDLVRSQDINLTLMQRQNELDDMINTTGTAFMGLTLGCARCHNHKFDPIRQTDYYSLQAIFAGIQHGDRALGATRNCSNPQPPGLFASRSSKRTPRNPALMNSKFSVAPRTSLWHRRVPKQPAPARCLGMRFTGWNTFTTVDSGIPTAGFPMNQNKGGFRSSCRKWRLSIASSGHGIAKASSAIASPRST